MYILIAIVFIAEVIIAYNLIRLIIKIDKKVIHLNCCVREFNPLAQTCLQYIRCLATRFSQNTTKTINFIKNQQQKVWVKYFLILAIYSILIIFKIRKVKFRKIIALLSAICDVAIDLTI